MNTNATASYLSRMLSNQATNLTATTPTPVSPDEAIASGLQPYDADLSSIGGLTGTGGYLKKTGLNTWVLESQVSSVTLVSSDVTTALGYTPVTNARTITINGVTYDLTQDRSWTIAGGVTSFNTRTGAITLISGDITGALGFTPYNATNPSGYISGINSGMVTTALGFTPENAANKGIANGYASLDGSGLIPSTQLPSYVDDVLEYADLSSFPPTGTTGKIYIDLTTNKVYRWSGTIYVEVSPTVGTIWGGITGTLANQTDLQTALNGKQPLDGDLTAIAALVGTIGFLKKTAANTWVLDTSTYLTSFTETDPIYTASSWYTTTNNSTNWNTAYSWGNHASAGYLTTSLASSTYLTISTAASTYLTSSTAASTYQPLDGDLTSIAGLAGTSGFLKKTAANTWALDTNTYLTSFTETDPTVGSHIKAITSTQITNWDTAYGWGNHAAAGYLTSATAATTYVPQTRTVTINGTTYDLSANRSWTISGVSGLTTSYIPKASSATTLADSLIYDSGTAVGIKTVSPAGSFEVNGAAKTSGSELLTYTQQTGVSVTTAYVGHLVQAADATNAATSASVHNGLVSSVGAVGTNTGGINVYGGHFNARPYSTSTGYVFGVGIQAFAIRNNAADVSTNASNGLTGLATNVGHQTSVNTSITTATVYGVSNTLLGARGTITTMAGQFTGALIGNGANNTALVTTFYGLRTGATVGATSGTGTGTITSYYDLYLEGATVQATGVVTNKWGVYQTNAAHTNYLAGALLIGTTTNSGFTVDITGTLRSTSTVTGGSFVKSGGTSAQFLKADGSVDASTYLTSFTETDPTVGSHIKAITTTQVSNWDSAYTQRLQWDGGSTNLVAATGRTSLGATTVGGNLFTLTNPTAVTFLRVNADNTVSTLDAATFRTAIGAGTSSTTGTVTSVAALTLGTTGTDLSSTVVTGTTTPVITLNVPTASASNRGALSSADWTTFNNKQAAISLTTTGNSGAATFTTNTLNIPNYTLAGLGGQASSTNLTSLSGLSYVSASFVKMTAAGTFSLDTNTYYLASNPSGFTSNTGTVTSVSGTGTVSGLTLTGTVTTTGSLTLGGTLTLTSGNVTTALGYTPYNSTNPNGYITSSGSITGNAATATKLTTPDLRSTSITPSYFGQGLNTAFMGNAQDGLSDGGTYHGIVQLQQWSDSSGGGAHQLGFTDNNNIWHRGSSGALTTWSSWVKIWDSGNLTNLNQLTNGPGYTSNTGTVTSVSGTGTVSGLTLSGTVTTSGSLTLGGTLSLTSGNVTTALGYTPYNSTNPSGYITGITSGMVTTALGYTPYNSTNPSGYITGITSGMVTTALGYTPYNSTNPNGYITSSGSISGNAATATFSTSTSRLYSTDASYNYSSGTPYYGYLTYDGSRWLFQVSPATPAAVRVSYSDSTGSVAWTNVSGRPTALSSFTNDSGYVTSSGSVNYATTAGSAPNGTNANSYYSVTAGEGNGVYFWQDSTNYTIKMGVTAGTYQYGPVTDYSMRFTMGGGTARGFTWGYAGAAPTMALNANSGNLQIAGTFTEASSIRYKEDIQDLTYTLDDVIKLRGVTYKKKGTSDVEIGVIAEEVNAIIPEVVAKNADGSIESVSYGRLTAVLIEAVKEQQKQIDELKNLLNKQ